MVHSQCGPVVVVGLVRMCEQVLPQETSYTHAHIIISPYTFRLHDFMSLHVLCSSGRILYRPFKIGVKMGMSGSMRNHDQGISSGCL